MGARPDDLEDFYDADIGRTVEVALTVAAAQTSDAFGALPPGRYLIQVATSSSADIAWMKRSKWVKTAAADITAAAPAFPFRAVTAIELNVRKGVSDRVQGIMGSGTGTLTITRISRGTQP